MWLRYMASTSHHDTLVVNIYVVVQCAVVWQNGQLVILRVVMLTTALRRRSIRIKRHELRSFLRSDHLGQFRRVSVRSQILHLMAVANR